MSALRKRSFKPILEALEDRCLLSANPLTVQSAEAVLAGILQDVQQQLTTLQGMAGNVFLASQQSLAGEADLSALASSQSIVALNSGVLILPQPGRIGIGAVVYPQWYYYAGVQAVAFYRWAPSPTWIRATSNPNTNNDPILFGQTTLLPVKPPSQPLAQTTMEALPAIFAGKSGTNTLQVLVQFYVKGASQPFDSAVGQATITIPPKGNPMIANLEQDLNDLPVITDDLILALQGVLAAQADSLITALAFSGV